MSEPLKDKFLVTHDDELGRDRRMFFESDVKRAVEWLKTELIKGSNEGQLHKVEHLQYINFIPSWVFDNIDKAFEDVTTDQIPKPTKLVDNKVKA